MAEAVHKVGTTLYVAPSAHSRDDGVALFSLDKKLGSVIPMLFTPVLGSALYEEYHGYLDEMGFDLQHLNGKLFPFLEFNQRRTPELTV